MHRQWGNATLNAAPANKIPSARKKSELLNESQAQFVDHIMSGLNQSAAAATLGGNKNGSLMMDIPKVQAEIARARQQVEDVVLLRRVDTINGFLDGIQTAKIMGDAGNIIRGWTEIGKVLGHYAPEVKTININHTGARLRNQLEALSDEELLAIAEGKEVVEGEYVED